MIAFNLIFKKYYLLFIVFFNAFFIGMYFSGVALLQNIAALNNDVFQYEHSREFGLLENAQFFLLLYVICGLYVIAKKQILEVKMVFLCALACFFFLLLEEIDYGIHFYRLLTDNFANSSNFNLHNNIDIGGKESTARLKALLDLMNALWFVLIPLICCLLKRKMIIVPPLHFAAAFIVILLFSKGAGLLNELGYGIIDGVQGSLDGNISEFREFSNYYLYAVYIFYLIDVNFSSKKITDFFK